MVTECVGAIHLFLILIGVVPLFCLHIASPEESGLFNSNILIICILISPVII
jgi:hypothetical protein